VVQQVEHHEQRRRGDGVRVGLAQPVEAGPELLVVDRHLAIQHERAGGQLRDRGGQVSEAARVVTPVAADQADGAPSLHASIRQPPSTFTS
jgi:hypothetical protein